jgi:DNA ligase-1
MVELPDGTRFSVGTGFSDAEREAPPAVGSMITFRYQELSEGGVPRFPSFVGVRADAPQPAARAKGPAKKASASVSSVAVVPAAAPAGKRYFELVEGTASKFWEVSVAGKEMTTRWGRLGSGGQSKTKAFVDGAAAQAEAARLIAEKTEKGYVEK